MYTINKFIGDGIEDTYHISFVDGYLKREHVFAYIEQAGQTIIPVTLKFLTDFTVEVSPTPGVGEELTIYRDTPVPAMVDFTQTHRLSEATMNLANRQALFKAVEMIDRAQSGSLVISNNGVTGHNLGAGLGLYAGKTADVLNFKSVQAGANVTVTDEGDSIRVSADTTGGAIGPAGGVLAGTYPNPSFRDPMAYATDLLSKADIGHTHSLDAIVQSGASVGQVPSWSGEAWVPTNVSGGGGGAPTGTAGGDLAGTYPNPVLRTPRASQEDLDALRIWLEAVAARPASSSQAARSVMIVQLTAQSAAANTTTGAPLAFNAVPIVADTTGILTVSSGTVNIGGTHPKGIFRVTANFAGQPQTSAGAQARLLIGDARFLGDTMYPQFNYVTSWHVSGFQPVSANQSLSAHIRLVCGASSTILGPVPGDWGYSSNIMVEFIPT